MNRQARTRDIATGNIHKHVYSPQPHGLVCRICGHRLSL